ncbi:hypothetical protein [Pseudomonas sp. MD332_8]|uniref:hypothetical protein n=1 Tax=unclassified Pseudomonas TaxID=196821 RepID=UPI0036D20DA5
MSEVKEHSVIYLAPACHEEHMQREWCEDDVWHACEECGSGDASVRYNLGTDFDRVTAERDQLQRQLDQKEQQRESELRNGQAGDRLVGELQQRLTAADERNDAAIDLLRRARAVIEDGGWADLERDIAKFLKP